MPFAWRLAVLATLTLGSWAHGQANPRPVSTKLAACGSLNPDGGFFEPGSGFRNGHFSELTSMKRMHRLDFSSFAIARFTSGPTNDDTITVLIEDPKLWECASIYFHANRGAPFLARIYFSRGLSDTFRILIGMEQIDDGEVGKRAQ